MNRVRPSFSLAALAFVLWVPSVAAQLPIGPPTATLQLEDLPAESETVSSAGGTYVADVTVRLTLNNLICSGEGPGRTATDVPVQLATVVRPRTNGTGNATVEARINPTTLQFSVPAGAYTAQAGNYEGTMFASLVVTASNLTGPGVLVQTIVEATLAADPMNYGCAGNGGLEETTADRNFTVEFLYTPPPTPTPSPTVKMPGPDVAFLAAAVLGGVAAIRRR